MYDASAVLYVLERPEEAPDAPGAVKKAPVQPVT